MTKVVFDEQVFAMQKFGGVSRYFCEIASRIDQRKGWHTQIVAPFHFNNYLASSTIPKFGIFIPNPHPRLNRFYRWANNVVAAPSIAIRKADLIHRTYYPEKQRRASVPTVITVYDMIHEVFPQYHATTDATRSRKRASVLAADHIICISHNTAKDLINILSVPSTKISVTHLGCAAIFGGVKKVTHFTTASTARPYLLYVGERGAYKNFARFLEAYASSPVLMKELDVIAFGSSHLTRNETARIEALGLRPSAIRRVAGSDEMLAAYYSNARAFVYPSEYEGFGIPPLEAMNCGCPVICSNSSSIPEVVGIAGEYFEPSSVESMRLAIERVAFDDERRSELVAAGYLQAQRFSWDRCADETIKAYQTVL